MKKVQGQAGRAGAARGWATLGVALALWASALPAAASDSGWIKPTPEELKMTELPGYPGAPALILNKEEITKDDLHVVMHYQRIKVLTEKGKEYANVELRFAASRDDGYYSGDEKNVTDVQGRTIHADGTIIPFTGKPYLKTLEKNKEYTYQARVFTLPDVEVGSIIEYRYNTRISDNAFESPWWQLQDELYTRNAHFVWYPTVRELMSEKGSVAAISWYQIMPKGATVSLRELPQTGPTGVAQKTFETTVKDVPPQPQEDHMPPISSFSYRVLFYYTPYRTAAEYWRAEGRNRFKAADSFAGPDGALRELTSKTIAGADTSEAKLRKIYAAVMALDNTDYTRGHARKEDQAQGLGKVSTAADVMKHERGNSIQLTELFVGMARAAGFKAYMMLVADRSRNLFSPEWLEIRQFDDMVAIVNVDGKEMFFDPGERYCQFGHLAWQKTIVGGLRQTDNGPEFAQTPSESYQTSKTTRVGDLTLDEHGELAGTLTVTYIGAPALHWRQQALRGDEESMRHNLRKSLESSLPKTLDVKVASIDNLSDYEKPLIAHFDVKGGVGTATGKRLILPMDVFLAEAGGSFPHEKREVPVYFHYPETKQDAVRVKFPATMSLEAAPADTRVMFKDGAQYTISSAKTANSITMRRNLLFNPVVVLAKDYPELRKFVSDYETKDKESIILLTGQAPATGAAAASSGGN